MSKNHVLVVDDEPFIRSILCRELPYFGLIVFEASNGEEAVHLLQKH